MQTMKTKKIIRLRANLWKSKKITIRLRMNKNNPIKKINRTKERGLKKVTLTKIKPKIQIKKPKK